MQESLFEPGRNCRAVVTAPRVAFVVDAEDYFHLFRLAAERAQRSIVILGWDFDSRTPLEHDASGKPTLLLGDFLDGLVARNRQLHVKILDWDYPMVFGTDREIPPTLGLAWQPHRRIDFRFDDTHPVAGSHHQKIVLIDDRLAFCGGLDLTSKRWDTCAHKAEEPRRTFDDKPYPPFHDAMMAVDGEAAEALAAVARERWLAATGEPLKPVQVEQDPWPKELPVELENARVAVSCTAPPAGKGEGVHEIESLYLDMIMAARRYIYIENQYFTSEVIGEALKARLAEPDGPEIVVVTRLLSHGWLEEVTMSTLRTKLVRELREADAHGHFHCYYPDVPGLCEGTCLDIHSKVMVVDDEWLRIGSSNLSNRSMGMDTECDVTVEARGDKRVGAVIRGFRDRLIGEHSGCEAKDVAAAEAKRQRLWSAIDSLGSPTRKLLPLPAPELAEAKLAVAKVGDPEAPIELERIVENVAPEGTNVKGFAIRKVLYILGGMLALALVLALLWTKTPLADWATRENAARLSSEFASLWWAPLVVIAAYTPASFIMFPRWIITMTAVLAFGPWHGFAYGFAGILIAGVATFLPGRMVGRETIHRAVGLRFQTLTRFLQRKGLIAVTIVRLVPLAPFPVVNLVMGALRVKLWHFVLGTFIGMLPGMLAATVLSEQIAAALEDPTRVNYWVVAVAIAVLFGLAFLGKRYVRRHGAAH